MSTTAQIAANRANSKLSTGPTSETGKAASKLNGLKTGLTGRTVVLPSEDLAAYQSHLEKFNRKFDPATDDERTLVQSLADTEWRLARIPALETGIYALGSLELAALFEEQGDDVRGAVLEAKIFVVYQRELKNLAMQETRLRRHREQDTAALKALQHERKNEGHKQLTYAAMELMNCVNEKMEFVPADFGFAFPLEKIQRRAAAFNNSFFPQIKLTQAEKSDRAADYPFLTKATAC
jgi:hypothetical protein